MQLAFDFPIKPQYSFSNFVVCTGNETALAFAERIMSQGSEENILFLHGPSGCGKTHLLTAISQSIHGSSPLNPLPVIPLELLTKENYQESLESLAKLPALLLDNLQLLQNDNNLRIALWQLFNDFYGSSRKIVATATLPPKELDTLDEHLKSRFMWGLVAKLDISDDNSRRMIMQKLAEDRQIILPAEVAEYLLVHLPRDISALTDALEQLRRVAFATQRKISLRLAREALPPATIFPARAID
jgi:chromosomal replication initiator protein